jgi:hypothetical protein
VDGRIVGGWGTRADGSVVTRLLDDVGREAERSLEAEAARLTEWLAPHPATIRFPAPLHRSLLSRT